MAITRDDFKNIPSNGLIPSDRVPASAFAIGYFFTYTGQADYTNPNQSFTTRLVLHVLDGRLGGVKYVIRIEEKFNLFIIPMGPGLAVYTWNQVPSAEKVEGFKVSGPVGPGWNPPEIASAPPMRTLGQGSFGIDPAEGTGTSGGAAIVDARFYSGIFTEPLAVGDSIKVKFHNAGAGYSPAIVSLQLATEGGSRNRIATTVDAFGGLLTARIPPDHPLIQAGRSWPHFQVREPGGVVKGSEPSLVVMGDGTQVLGCMIDSPAPGGYVEYFSENDGWRWQRMRYPDTKSGFGMIEKIVWDVKTTMPLLARVGDRRITIRVSGGQIQARVIERDLDGIFVVGPAVAGESYSIDATADGGLFIVDSSGKPAFESVSGGRRWSPINTGGVLDTSAPA